VEGVEGQEDPPASSLTRPEGPVRAGRGEHQRPGGDRTDLEIELVVADREVIGESDVPARCFPGPLFAIFERESDPHRSPLEIGRRPEDDFGDPSLTGYRHRRTEALPEFPATFAQGVGHLTGSLDRRSQQFEKLEDRFIGRCAGGAEHIPEGCLQAVESGE